jgi:hypothetical protein
LIRSRFASAHQVVPVARESWNLGQGTVMPFEDARRTIAQDWIIVR